MVSVEQIVHQFFVVYAWLFPKKLVATNLKVRQAPSPSPSECDQMHCLQEVPEFVDRQRRLFYFCFTYPRKLVTDVLESQTSFVHCFYEVFHQTQLDMQWWQQDFLGLNKRRMLNTFLSRFK